MREDLLVIEDLCKSYDGTIALNHLNLTIQKGEFFGFVGSNGAGKTTLLRILAGLLTADSGQIRLEGSPVFDNLEQWKQRIGYVPDFFGVYDNLQVMEYMEFYASLYGIIGEEAKTRCVELLELVHLKDRADQMVDHLSRGMKQRLCLARSLVHNPDILILDEPVSGMDPRGRQEFKELLKQLNQHGKSIIISSHILPELASMCNTIGIIQDGEIRLKGSLEEISKRVYSANPLEIQVTGDREKAVEILKEHDCVVRISIADQIIYAGFQGDEQEQIQILQELVSGGIPVVSYQRKPGDLEAVFNRVTERRGTAYEI